MAKTYKTRRVKLKRHDAGYDRHNKGVAFQRKVARLEASHHRGRSEPGRKPA